MVPQDVGVGIAWLSGHIGVSLGDSEDYREHVNVILGKPTSQMPSAV